MAESTLSLDYAAFAKEVAYLLGFGRDTSLLNASQTALVDDLIQTGYRWFLYPELSAVATTGYEWSFLRATATLTTVASDYDMTLSDDFGGLLGELTFNVTESGSKVSIIPESRIRELRQDSTDAGLPEYAALVPVVFVPATGQRWQVLLHPPPDGVYHLTYAYKVQPGKLTTANKYPLGGMPHCETVKEAILAAAEQSVKSEAGLHTQKFIALLAASIAYDRNSTSPELLGYNADRSAERLSPDQRHGADFTVTYHGV